MKQRLTPKERLFYAELKEEMICSQKSKARSGLIQILVQNYLEHQFNSNNVFLYPEIINDIDAFNENLETRGVIIDGSIDSSITICAFLRDYVSDNSYLSSYEVKSGENDYILKFKNLKQILTKIIYPENVELVLVLVPNVDENFSELKKNIRIFNVIKSRIQSMNEKNKYKLFNEMVLNENYDNSSITSALSTLINIVNDGKCQADVIRDINEKKEKCITEEQSKILMSQFDRLRIEVLTIEDLSRYDINKEFVFRIIRLLDN